MKEYLQALRPPELLIYAIALVVSARLSANSGPLAALLSPSLLIALISTALLYGGGNIISGRFDQSPDSEADTGKNKTGKPLIPAGLTIGAALLLSLFCGLRFLSGSLFIAALLIIQGRYWKAPGVFRCFLRALTGSMVFILGPLLTGDAGLSLYCLPVAFLLTASREIVSDIESLQDDREAGAVSIPIRIGIARAFITADVLSASALAITVACYSINPFSRIFLTFLSFAILIFLIGNIFVFIREANTFRRYIETVILLLLLGAAA